MLFKERFLEPIQKGEVTLTFRRWRRPQAKVGSRHRLWDRGLLEILAVDRVESVSEKEARRAGYERAELLEELSGREGDLYRIEFRFSAGLPDPGARPVDSEALATLVPRLKKMGSWTLELLRLIQLHPGLSSKVLAEKMDWDRKKLKASVRKLKGLGLTESLEVGYRVSVRGASLLQEAQELP